MLRGIQGLVCFWAHGYAREHENSKSPETKTPRPFSPPNQLRTWPALAVEQRLGSCRSSPGPDKHERERERELHSVAEAVGSGGVVSLVSVFQKDKNSLFLQLSPRRHPESLSQRGLVYSCSEKKGLPRFALCTMSRFAASGGLLRATSHSAARGPRRFHVCSTRTASPLDTAHKPCDSGLGCLGNHHLTAYKSAKSAS